VAERTEQDRQRTEQGRPLRPVESDFLPVTRNAVLQRDRVSAFVAECCARGIDSILFVGTGGSFASSVQAVATLRSRLRVQYVDNVMSAEVSAAPPLRVGERTLVIASSHSGATPETVAATELLKSRGATIISLSTSADSPLADLADLALTYGSERTITSPKQILLSHITWALVEQLEGEAPDAARITAYDALPEALRESIDESEETLAEIARSVVGTPLVYVLGAGPNYGGAYLLSMCYLMEMQWMRSVSFYAGEFFHGAFEMVVPEVSVITLLGEDPTRPVAERAASFAGKYSEHAHTLDTSRLTLRGVPAEMRGEVTPIVLGVLASRLAEHIEAVTGHSLDERRYMHRVEY